MKKFRVKIKDKNNTDHYITTIHPTTYGIETSKDETAAKLFTEYSVRNILNIFLHIPTVEHQLIIEVV